MLDDESGGTRFFGGNIWGDRVVWAMGYGVLKEHRISTGVTRTVIDDRSLSIHLVSLWDRYAVFRNEGSGSWLNVFLVDLETGEHHAISPSRFMQEQPDINDGRIVWTDFRGGEGFGGGGGGGMHIFVHSLRTGHQYVLNPSAMGGSEPRIFGRTILWQGRTEGAPGGIWVTRIGDI